MVWFQLYHIVDWHQLDLIALRQRAELNQDWSERRNDFCLMQNMREKRKAAGDEL